jgi:hypothetical protein
MQSSHVPWIEKDKSKNIMAQCPTHFLIQPSSPGYGNQRVTKRFSSISSMGVVS